MFARPLFSRAVCTLFSLFLFSGFSIARAQTGAAPWVYLASSLFGEEAVYGFSATEAGSIAVDSGSVVDESELGELSSYQLIHDSHTAGSTPTTITAHGDRIYWGDTDGSLYSSALDGSDFETIFSGRERIESIALQGSKLYWIESTAADVFSRHLYSANGDGSGVTQLTTTAGDYTGLEANSVGLYYLSGVTRVYNRSYADLLSATEVYFDNGTTLEDIAVNETQLYLANATSSHIMQAALDGSGLNATFIQHPGLIRPAAIELIEGSMLVMDELSSNERDLYAFNLLNPGDDPVALVDGEFYGQLSRSEYFAVVGASAVPEPATVALILGAAALGMAVYRRRRR